MTMVWSCFLMGTCACNRYDMEQAERYYDRVFALTRGNRRDMSNYIFYNLGSSYLEVGDEENARRYLKRAKEQEKDGVHNLLLHQKLAIVCCQSGEWEKGLAHLEKAKQWLKDIQWPAQERRTQLLSTMIRFAELMFDEEAMRGQEFETVTRTLFDETEGQFSFGFKRFYGRFLAQIYKRQRRYKDALMAYEQMNVR